MVILRALVSALVANALLVAIAWAAVVASVDPPVPASTAATTARVALTPAGHDTNGVTLCCKRTYHT